MTPESIVIHHQIESLAKFGLEVKIRHFNERFIVCISNFDLNKTLIVASHLELSNALDGAFKQCISAGHFE